MSENLESPIDVQDADFARDLHDKIQAVMDKATDSMPHTGIVIFALLPDGPGARIAHMTNMEIDSLMALMKEWMLHQDQANERDHIH